MGGTRFSNLVGDLPRMDQPTYERRLAVILGRLHAQGIAAKSMIPLASKTDHGDLDLIADKNQFEALGIKAFADMIGAAHHSLAHVNDTTPAFIVYDEDGPYQIDIKIFEPHQIDYATSFHSYGDAGSLTAMIAAYMGLSMGAYGLKVRLGKDDKTLKVLTDYDYAQSLTILGLDADVFAGGFANEQEVFDWLIAGRYFNPEFYLIENMAAKRRSRANKRPMQHRFRALVADMQPNTLLEPRENSDYWQNHWRSVFPEIGPREAQMRADEEAANRIQWFKRGSVVTEATGREGKALQHIMHMIGKDEQACTARENEDREAFIVRVKELHLIHQ